MCSFVLLASTVKIILSYTTINLNEGGLENSCKVIFINSETTILVMENVLCLVQVKR